MNLVFSFLATKNGLQDLSSLTGIKHNVIYSLCSKDRLMGLDFVTLASIPTGYFIL